MKQRRLADLRSLISHPDFQAWWDRLVRARETARAARHGYDELLSQTTLMEFRAELTQKNAIDTLYRAGELEDLAANLAVEAQALENRSLLAVADFEEQRYRVSELWYRLGAAERALELAQGAQKDPAPVQKALRQAKADYEREDGHKTRLWEEVEKIWARSAEVSLMVSEHRVQGRKIRKEAEGLFQLAEERKQRGQALRVEAEEAGVAVEEAEKEISRLLDDARDHFGCAPGTEFLFFRSRDNQKLAWAVCLVEDRESFNVEVKPLALYAVDQQRGVGFLEPARMDVPSEAEGDKRFEEYFLSGRKGEVRAAGA